MTAQESFETARLITDIRLERIKKAIEKLTDKFNETDKKEWGFSGSLVHVNDELQDIINFLGV